MLKVLTACVVGLMIMQGCTIGRIFPPEDQQRAAEIRQFHEGVEVAMSDGDLSRARDAIERIIDRLLAGPPAMSSIEEYRLHMSITAAGVWKTRDPNHQVVAMLRRKSDQIEQRLMDGQSNTGELRVLYTISAHGSLHPALRRVMEASATDEKIASQFKQDRTMRSRLRSHYLSIGRADLARRLGYSIGDLVEDSARITLSIPGVILTLPLQLIMMGGRT